MLIAIDVDGVLANFIPSIADFHNYSYGTNLKKDDFFSLNLHKVWGGTREEDIKKVDEYGESVYLDRLKPVNKSIECINKLKEKNKLIIITSRPDKIYEKTKDWIDKYFSGAFLKIYFAYNYERMNPSPKKEDICFELGADFIIEDNLNHAIDCAEKGIKSILIDQPWNQSDELRKNIIRVKDWSEIPVIIENLTNK